MSKIREEEESEEELSEEKEIEIKLEQSMQGDEMLLKYSDNRQNFLNLNGIKIYKQGVQNYYKSCRATNNLKTVDLYFQHL